MEIPSEQQMLASIEAFLAKHEMPPTRFGREAVGEASLITSLRNGRSLTLRLANKVAAFMAEHDATVTAEHPSPEAGKPHNLSSPVMECRA